MRATWPHAHVEDQHAPVEMRFIDMFMTAVGSLVFLALLLVVLLSNMTYISKEESEDKAQDSGPLIEKLRSDIQVLSALNESWKALNDLQNSLNEALTTENKKLLGRTEDTDILKRWFSVSLVTNGCSDQMPELYVRPDAPLQDLYSGTPIPNAKEFNASDVFDRTTLFGHRYFDVLDVFGAKGSRARLFNGISRGAELYSVYVGLSNPVAQGMRECAVQPVYITFSGVAVGERIVMTRSLPFAWLRRFKINMDGTSTLFNDPRDDNTFRRDLVQFSQSQAAILCQRRTICNTGDAHLAVLQRRQQ